MFTVKAEVRTQTGPTTFQLYQCESVEVAKSKSNGSNGPGQPPYIPNDIDVWLRDSRGDCVKYLPVGTQIDHYCAVYVMNERGKTVETIYPGPGEVKAAA